MRARREGQKKEGVLCCCESAMRPACGGARALRVESAKNEGGRERFLAFREGREREKVRVRESKREGCMGYLVCIRRVCVRVVCVAQQCQVQRGGERACACKVCCVFVFWCVCCKCCVLRALWWKRIRARRRQAKRG